ncbi:MAG TPA: methyltransferase domain-containing protein [Pyrinomonadaceae bacterium]
MIPERYVWAVDTLDVQPGDTILEIGCGYGHSVPLICSKLGSGLMTAIDRSEKMVKAASEANQQHLDTGKVRILHCELLDSDLPSGHFNKIFLYNLNVFWMDPRDELAEVRRLLKPDGRFYIFHQPPPGHELEEFENAFLQNLSKYEFSLFKIFKDQSETVRSVALVAKPSPR